MKVLIEFEKKPVYFSRPKHVIRCFDPAQLNECFQKIEDFLEKGYYAAGFLSYEAGYAFEEKLNSGTKSGFPLLQMGCYEGPQTRQPFSSAPKSNIQDLTLNITKGDYAIAIEDIRRHIALGDVYQITYCIKNRFSFQGSTRGLYRSLLKAQPVPYPAYIETDEFQILSLSPELFLKKQNSFIMTKPMKGTWARAEGFIPDLFAGLRLKYDGKNRAENIMIADLLRNDLGRIGNRIKAPRLFEVRKYATLFQMTSTVTARVPRDVSLYGLFRSVFPSGSVTGAPKIRAMEIIRDLEKEERKIYTGAIGYIAPNKDLFFNIPIRTLLIQGGRGEMGVGGGIVWDSTPDGEWEEGMLKGKFLKTQITQISKEHRLHRPAFGRRR